MQLSGGKSSSDATGGTASGMFDNSGFVVNFGNDNNTSAGIKTPTAGIPFYVWIAGAVLAAIWLAKR